MSGHSKWSSIKHKKGAADAKRGQLFTKLTRALIVAAKDGGARPGLEPRARRTRWTRPAPSTMPNDTIDRAIKKGTGDPYE